MKVSRYALKPALHCLWTESDKVPQLAIRQALLAKRGHMPNTASSVSGNVVDGPQIVFCGWFNGSRCGE